MTDIAPEAPAAPAETLAAADPLAGVEQALQVAEAAELTRADKIDAAIAAWVSSDLTNSPVSQATAAWNHMATALPRLAAKLKEL